jgi:hypothetical protein
LNLSDSNLTDISPLGSFLKLRSLWLDYNQIQNVEPLGGLTRLAFLSLNNNHLKNVKSLNQLTNLRWLFLNHNKIQQLNFVDGMKNLKFLGLKSNEIIDTSSLSTLPQTTFVLATDNPVDNGQCFKNHFGALSSLSVKNKFITQGKCFPWGNSVDKALEQTLHKFKNHPKLKLNYSVSNNL